MELGVRLAAIFAVLFATLAGTAQARTGTSNINYDVTCSSSMMKVTVNLNDNSSVLYLERLKGYPACHPEMGGGKAVFKLSLENIYACGTTRMIHKLTGQKIYYHRVIIEHPDKNKEVILVRCAIPGDAKRPAAPNERYRRQLADSLPHGFREAEADQIDIIKTITAKAPMPFLNLVLRQNGRVVDTALNVQPGTPLEMLIYLDEKSADVYGLLASYLKVTDNTPNQEEIIIMNGCSIDPYIFGNFETQDGGDTLSAKFRAFKFPDTNYVLFVGTVNVCLKECQGVPCGKGLYGYGRRKREIPAELPTDPNKIFEVEMTAFLKVEFSEDLFKLKQGNLVGKFDEMSSMEGVVEIGPTSHQQVIKAKSLYYNSTVVEVTPESNTRLALTQPKSANLDSNSSNARRKTCWSSIYLLVTVVTLMFLGRW